MEKTAYHVYILRSAKNPNQIYTGFTSIDVQDRLTRHNSGSTPATRRFAPWVLVWFCTFFDKETAMAFEAYLKTGSGRAFLHKRLLRAD